MAGIFSALAPVAIGLVVLLLVPVDVATRHVDADLERALSVASARVVRERADLEFALARLDDAELRALVSAGGGRATLPDVEGVVAIHGAGGDARPSRDGGDLVHASVDVVTGGGTKVLTVQRPDAGPRILRDVGARYDVSLRAGSRNELGNSGDVARVSPIAGPGAGAEALEASVEGSSLELLLRARGEEIWAALALLLAAGVVGAIAVALITNRMLCRVARVAERMSGGDFDARLPIIGADAGARVALSINELARKLQDRIGALEGTVERLDRTLTAIDDGVCTWSADGNLQTWNESAARITGIDFIQARADGPTTDLLREQREPGRRRVLLPLVGGGSHLAIELQVRRMGDGGTLQAFHDAAPALSIEQARTNFLVTAAHELRTPLTSILGFAATLADRDLELAADTRTAAQQQLYEDALRLDGVVASLFENSLLARDKIEVVPEPVEVGAVLGDAIAAARAAVRIDLVEGDGLVLRADRRAVVRALAAILDNAAKYGVGPVSVSASSSGSTVRVVVRDRGPGIPSELHEAVFEPFFRADPEMRSEVGGAGMGLYAARRLVEAMGGSIAVLDDGTSAISIELPGWPGDRDRPPSPARDRADRVVSS